MKNFLHPTAARAREAFFPSGAPALLIRRCLPLWTAGLLFLSACLPGSAPFLSVFPDRPLRHDGSLAFLRPDGREIVSIAVEISETPRSIARGLMGRKSLDQGSGMLFLFGEAEPRTFWMHNTPLSLDILFVGEHQCVLNIAARTEPMSDRTYDSEGPAKYVVEVRAGFCERYGIRQGTCIRWQRRSKEDPLFHPRSPERL